MSKFLQEFKEFAMRGNVLDMAVGVIIGGAFGKIVSSLVDNVFMPVIGVLTGGIDFSGLTVKFQNAEIKYGLFIQNIIDFLIVAFCIFVFIKAINRFAKKDKPAPQQPATPKEPAVLSTEEKLLTEIRDLLKENKV